MSTEGKDIPRSAKKVVFEMRRVGVGIGLCLVLVVACPRFGDVPIVFSSSPAKPTADDRLTIRYVPEASHSPLVRSERVEFRFTLVGPGKELYTDVLPMVRKGGEWRVRLRPSDFLRPNPVVMVCSFLDSEDPEICDSNQGDPWVLQFYEEGKLARGAEFRLYQLSKSNFGMPTVVGTPTGAGRGARGLDAELAAHPDFLPAREARWLSILEEARENSGVSDSLRLAIGGELDAVFDRNLRSEDPDTMVAPLLAVYETIGEAAKAESLLAQIRLRFPGSRFVARCAFHWAYAPDDLEPALSRLGDFVKDDPDSPEAEQARNLLFMIYDNVMQTPEKAGELVLGGKPIGRGHLERYAEILVAAGDMEGAEAIARRCVREAEDDEWSGSGLLTPMEWERKREEELRGYTVLLARILGERNVYDEAAALLEPLVEAMARAGDREGLGDLAEYQNKLGKKADALLTYERLGESAHASDEDLRVWRSLYVDVKGSDSGFDDRLAMLEERRRANQHRQLEKRALDWPAPNVTLTDLDGRLHALEDFRGKVVLLDFWATWCGPCLNSLPKVEEFLQSIDAREEVAVLAINTWERGTPDERRAMVEEKWAELGLSLPVYLDLGASGEETSPAAEQFRVPFIPTLFVIDREGRILFRRGGLYDEGDREDLRLKIDYALSRGARAAS